VPYDTKINSLIGLFIEEAGKFTLVSITPACALPSRYIYYASATCCPFILSHTFSVSNVW